MPRSWKESIPFLCLSELEQDTPFPLAGEIMSQPNPGMDYHPGNDKMDLIKEALASELSYTRRSGYPNEPDESLFQDLLDENIHARSDPNWQEQVSRRIKAVAWRIRVQEDFLGAALLLAQQGLIESDFRAALEKPMDVSAFEIHPSIHAVETAFRRFDKAWRMVSIKCFPEDLWSRRHLASPFAYTFSWLATVIVRSAKTTELEPILDVLSRSQLFGQLETLSPPIYGVEAWQRFAETGVPCSPPGAPARFLNGKCIKLVDIIFEPATKFIVDPNAGCYPETDPRAKGGRFRGAALNFWLPATGMGEGDDFVKEVRRYVADLKQRRAMVKFAFEAWFGEGRWGEEGNANEALGNFVETATEGRGAGEEVEGYGSEDEEEGNAARAAQEEEKNQVRDDDGIEPFPPFPFDDWEDQAEADDEYSSSEEEENTSDEVGNGYIQNEENETTSTEEDTDIEESENEIDGAGERGNETENAVNDDVEEDIFTLPLLFGGLE